MGGQALVRRDGTAEIPTGGLVGTDRVVPLLKRRGRLLFFRNAKEGFVFEAGRLALLAGGSLERSINCVLITCLVSRESNDQQQ